MISLPPFHGTQRVLSTQYRHRRLLRAQADLELRTAIGTDQIMWGSDYPHPEGTWPNTAEYFKTTFSDFLEADGRKILGDNAVRFYGLDRAKLQVVANRIGPMRPCSRESAPRTGMTFTPVTAIRLSIGPFDPGARSRKHSAGA